MYIYFNNHALTLHTALAFGRFILTGGVQNTTNDRHELLNMKYVLGKIINADLLVSTQCLACGNKQRMSCLINVQSQIDRTMGMWPPTP